MIYVYGPESSHAPSFLIKDKKMYKIILDPGTSSVRYVVDPTTTQIMQELEYDEYGNMLRNTNPGFQQILFTGGMYDEDTKLIRLGARDYDPTIGRWTTKDPIGFAGGDTNLYAYVGGDPMSYVDPSGLRIDDPGGIVPSNVQSTGLYRTLNAQPQEIFIMANSSLPAYGRTQVHRTGQAQLVQINLGLHNNSDDMVDTFMHELNHANQNLLLGSSNKFDMLYREFYDTNIILPGVKKQLGGNQCR